MDDIYPILEYMNDPRKKVLATIIQLEGSAYKKAGSTMLFLDDGTQIGLLSAGCLEEDLAYSAVKSIKNNKALTVQYDLREETDLGWGQGAGCNGMLEILLEPINDQLKTDLLKLKSFLEKNIPVLIIKDKGKNLFQPLIGGSFGSLHTDVGPEAFQYLFQPKPRLIVFGGGPDMRPLVSLASNTGFTVTVCDWREEFCQKKFFPNANQLLIGFPQKLVKRISFSFYDFIVIATHNFQRDMEILNQLASKEIGYIGVLGPCLRTKRLFGNHDIPNNIHSPVGLSIGANGPEEIAISIMAELIECWRKPSHNRVKNV